MQSVFGDSKPVNFLFSADWKIIEEKFDLKNTDRLGPIEQKTALQYQIDEDDEKMPSFSQHSQYQNQSLIIHNGSSVGDSYTKFNTQGLVEVKEE